MVNGTMSRDQSADQKKNYQIFNTIAMLINHIFYYITIAGTNQGDDNKR